MRKEKHKSLSLFIASRSQNICVHYIDSMSLGLLAKCGSKIDSLNKAGSREGGYLLTVIGVGARELIRSCTLSPYTTSMKSEADRICPSAGSAALKDGIKDSQLEGSKVCPLSDLYMRSSDSCVRPRCDLEPSIVWLFTWVS